MSIHVKKHPLQLETSIYIGLWVLLFAAPVLVEWVQMQTDFTQDFHWQEVWMAWKQLLPFALVFIVHDIWLAPLLIFRQRRKLYFALMTALFALFVTYQCTQRPPEHKRHFHHKDMRMHPRKFRKERPDFDAPLPARKHFDKEPPPPFFFSRHDFISVLILLLMLGVNLGVKFYSKNRRDAQRLNELERRSLEQQLEHLRYQLNPHFFMNTLNNIHALVDIDPELAQEAIVELSRLMRFVLYEADKPSVPLSQELAFLNHYVKLMRLRYSEHVRIDTIMPDPVPSVNVPPLLMITFVENAFKHGISYQKDSFIDIRIQTEGDRLLFSCTNSKQAATSDTNKGGLGLRNVRQRLDLLFADDYLLDLKEDDRQYAVRLNIPLSSPQNDHDESSCH